MGKGRADVEELFAAVKEGDLQRVRELVEERPELARAIGNEGPSPLLWARYHDRTEIVDFLRASIEELDIFEAAALGDVERIEKLLNEDPELANGYSRDGWTPLHLASHFGELEAVEALLEHGANVVAISRNSMTNMPLHAAAAGPHLEICRRLLAAGAEVNAHQHGGWTPLHAAAQQGNRELMELLLEHGADPGISNDEGELPTVTAARRGHMEVARLLGTSSAGR